MLDFFTPIDNNLLIDIKNQCPFTLGEKVVFNTETEFPDLTPVRIAIFGVLEDRGAKKQNSDADLSFFRKEFYSLFPGNWNFAIADLGDIIPGKSIEDTYVTLTKVVEKLIKINIIPIIVGGSQDLTYPIYRAYDNLEQMVNLVSVDCKFDIARQNSLPSDSYLTRILMEEPSNLFNYTNLGYQTYFNSQEEIDLMEKLYFDIYRLGDVSFDQTISEPVFRDADLVSIDFSSIKSPDSGNVINHIPNGFTGKEICTLSRYAGISDKTTSFAIFNHNYNQIESVLIAQILWYFIEGFHCRWGEYPFGTKETYLKYIVSAENNEDLIFYKSDKTDRWWIEISDFSGTESRRKKHSLVPCLYKDYLSTCDGEIPERIWKLQRKNIIYAKKKDDFF